MIVPETSNLKRTPTAPPAYETALAQNGEHDAKPIRKATAASQQFLAIPAPVAPLTSDYKQDPGSYEPSFSTVPTKEETPDIPAPTTKQSLGDLFRSTVAIIKARHAERHTHRQESKARFQARCRERRAQRGGCCSKRKQAAVLSNDPAQGPELQERTRRGGCCGGRKRREFEVGASAGYGAGNGCSQRRRKGCCGKV